MGALVLLVLVAAGLAVVFGWNFLLVLIVLLLIAA